MTTNLIEQYIRSLELKREEIPSFNQFPFNLPAVRNLGTMSFHPKVTFVVGENGSGKSTILEAIAIAYGFNPEGGTKNLSFSTKDTHSELHDYIRLTKGIKKPQDGFFLRAESFYNVATSIDEMGLSLFDYYGGRSLHEQSHGESFLAVILNRFNGKGLYILDEPEAALSPSRQMSLITRIHELVKEDSQLIISTHSPILMAYPESWIYLITDNGIEKVNYEDTEHYQMTRSFLNNPQKMLSILME